MPDKLGPGIIHHQPPSAEERARRIEAQLKALEKKRDDARWYIVAGVAMLFAGSFSVYFAMGGVVMAVYGGAAYGYWSRKRNAIEDPWDDDEIDAWERDEFGEP